MQVIDSVESMRAYRAGLDSSKMKIGFVATMGALHAGHISLIESAKKSNTHIIVSIFVNPTQFGANEDFGAYPRNLEKDIALCASNGVSALFTPQVNEIYEDDEISLNPPKNMGYILEGFDRPTHFAGVLQVVLKLLNIIKPHNAYFGKKDAQQLLILQTMARQLFLDVNIMPCEILRDSDNLALSSRNVYLSKADRAVALLIPKAIFEIKSLVDSGELEVARLESRARDILKHKDLHISYALCLDRGLKRIEKIIKNNSIFLIAAKVGKTRLIDNVWL